jgi:uncharacterized membrane protein YgcG
MTGTGGEAPGRQDVPGPQPSRGTKRVYFLMMGTCIGLFVLAWAVVDRYSTIAAVVMSAVALVIPPVAVIIANRASAIDRRSLAAGRGQEDRGGSGGGDDAVGGGQEARLAPGGLERAALGVA